MSTGAALNHRAELLQQYPFPALLQHVALPCRANPHHGIHVKRSLSQETTSRWGETRASMQYRETETGQTPSSSKQRGVKF